MKALLAPITLLIFTAGAAGQDVVRSLSPEQAEKMLTARKVEFKKSPADPKGNVVLDFKKLGVSMGFYLFEGGKDIMVDAVLPPIPLEGINQWNIGAKFSRACVRREGTQLATVLEANLDLQGGVTLDTINRLLDNFEDDVKNFVAFSTRAFKEEPLLSAVTDEQIEKMLSRLGLKFDRKENKDLTTFSFEMQGHKVKLASLKGKELFLDAIFPGIALEHANRYNLQKKFIRVVNLKADGEPFTTLQAALDLQGGVTESIILHFLTSFEVEVEQFGDFRRKLAKE